MYVKKGKGSVYYQNKTYEVKENDVVLIDCNKPHMYTSEDWETEWIHFDGNKSKEYFELIYERSGCIISLKKSIIIPKYLRYIIDNFKTNKIPSEPLVSCYIQRMITELLLISSDSNYEKFDSSNPILDAIAYIENNYKTKISLEVLALNVNLSVFHFSRMFKKETGYSPHEYIIMVRLNEVKKLLKTTSLTIKEIAFTTGFNSESNFVTCFKNNTKITPTVFRNTAF
jgi:AraC family transcriptional regulator